MNEPIVNPICRYSFATQQLMSEHPPKLRNRNKLAVFNIACPSGSTYNGQITFSRWQKMPFPPVIAWDGTNFEVREDVFGYEPNANNDVVEWYLNFANYDLFAYYGGVLLAQDEMQVAEHPALGALREALLASKIEPLCVENNVPTPALIMGVERRCKIATDRNAAFGRPYGLYGNNFGDAKETVVRQATTAIVPPTISNILAMEAPSFGEGAYTSDQLDYILGTAYTGFSAARIESGQGRAIQPKTVIHTGFWGCGAYGGNRMLMVLLQLLAATLSRIDSMVFHTFDASGTRAYQTALDIFQREVGEQEIELISLLTKIQAMSFQWGVGDGT